MTKHFGFLFVLLFALLLAGSASALDISSCQQLSTTGETYNLTTDILGHTGICFTIYADNIILDLGDHTISGKGSGYGVYIQDSDNATIQNGTISNFDYGIRVLNSTGNNITGLEISGNDLYGIYLDSSTSQQVTTVDLSENGQWDFYIYAPNDTQCAGNQLTGVTGSGGRAIEYYYNTPAVLQDSEFSELILCDADNSNLSNVTINGSDSLNNNGLLVLHTENSDFDNVASSNNYCGIHLSHFSNSNVFTAINASGNQTYGIYSFLSSNNQFEGITANSNLGTGIGFQISSPSTFSDVTANGNTNNGITFSGINSSFSNIIANQNSNGITIFSGTGNTFSNVTASQNSNNGFDFYSCSGNTVSNSNVSDNGNYGLYFSGSQGNTLSNLTLNNNSIGFRLFSNSTANAITNITARHNVRGFYSTNSPGNTITESNFCGNTTEDVECWEDQTEFTGNYCDSGDVCGGTCVVCPSFPFQIVSFDLQPSPVSVESTGTEPVNTIVRVRYTDLFATDDATVEIEVIDSSGLTKIGPLSATKPVGSSVVQFDQADGLTFDVDGTWEQGNYAVHARVFDSATGELHGHKTRVLTVTVQKPAPIPELSVLLLPLLLAGVLFVLRKK